MTDAKDAKAGSDPERDLTLKNFELEKLRYRTELLKWIVLAVGAIVSIVVIDVGRLKLESQQARSQNERALLSAYLTATETAQPQVWTRKLEVLRTFATDEVTRTWATEQLAYIDQSAALESLYLETLKVASLLVDPGQLNISARLEARSRFEQLYFADLPFFREHGAVSTGMVAFRNALLAAEASGPESEAWESLQAQMLQLAATLSRCTRALQKDPELDQRQASCPEQ